MQADLPPVIPAQPECDASGSPAPGCGRRNLKRLATMAFELNQMALAESDPAVRERYRNAIASLGELISFS